MCVIRHGETRRGFRLLGPNVPRTIRPALLDKGGTYILARFQPALRAAERDTGEFSENPFVSIAGISASVDDVAQSVFAQSITKKQLNYFLPLSGIILGNFDFLVGLFDREQVR